jgi:hypothetical protein
MVNYESFLSFLLMKKTTDAEQSNNNILHASAFCFFVLFIFRFVSSSFCFFSFLFLLRFVSTSFYCFFVLLLRLTLLRFASLFCFFFFLNMFILLLTLLRFASSYLKISLQRVGTTVKLRFKLFSIEE